MFQSPLPDKIVTLDETMWTSIEPVARENTTAQIIATGNKDDGMQIEATYPTTARPYGRTTPVNVRCNDSSILANIAQYYYRWLSRPYDVVLHLKACQLELGDRVGITYSGEGISWTDLDFYVQSLI